MLRLDLWPTPAKPLTGSVQTRCSVSATVSAWDPACPSGDHSNKRSSWHALIEPTLIARGPSRAVSKRVMTPAILSSSCARRRSPHIASNINGRHSTIDDRTTGHPSYGSVLVSRWFRSRVSGRQRSHECTRRATATSLYFLTLLAISTIASWAERTAPSCQPGIQLMCSPAK